MRTSKIICLPNCLFHFQSIKNSQTNIINHSRLELSIHSFNDKLHPIEHLHLHTPFWGDCLIWFGTVEHIGGSDDCNIWIDGFNFLFADPFGSKSHAWRIWVSSSSWYVNKSFHIFIFSAWSSYSHWNSDIWFFKIWLFFGENSRADCVNNSVLISNNKINVFLVREALKLNVSFMSQISSWLDFFEVQTKNGTGTSIWINTSGSESSKGWTNSLTENTSSTKNGGIDTRYGVSSSLIINMHSFQFIVSSWSINQHRLLLNMVWSNHTIQLTTDFHF